MDKERLFLSAARQGGAGDEVIDPEPFWSSLLTFDQDQDGRISKEEITDLFTLPIRPELPIEHPGFGIPLPKDPEQRRKRQADLFGWRDKNQDGFFEQGRIRLRNDDWKRSTSFVCHHAGRPGRHHPNPSCLEPPPRHPGIPLLWFMRIAFIC